MAEALIYARNTKNDPFDPHQGAIIAVRPNGFKWGMRESIEEWVAAGNDAADFPNDFVILKLPSVSPNGKMLEYAQDHFYYDVAQQKHTHQYKWVIPLDMVPAGLLSELQTNRVATRNWTISQIKAYTKNRVTGVFEG